MCACLRERKFGNYLGNLLIIPEIRTLFRKNNKKVQDFEHYAMRGELLLMRNFEPGKIPLPLFLLYSGFLTIVDYTIKKVIQLNYPNLEIRKLLTDELPSELIGNDDEGKSRLKNALERNDTERLVYLLNKINFEDDLLSPSSVRRDTVEFTCTKTINSQKFGIGRCGL